VKQWNLKSIGKYANSISFGSFQIANRRSPGKKEQNYERSQMRCLGWVSDWASPSTAQKFYRLSQLARSRHNSAIALPSVRLTRETSTGNEQYLL